MRAGDSEKVGEACAPYDSTRKNQQCSQPLRKEYIQHLERQLLSLERQSIAQMQEFQERRGEVMRENSLLRSLLMFVGVTKTEIEAHLESQEHPTSPQSQCQPNMSPVNANPRPPTSQNDPLANCHDLPTSSTRMESGNSLRKPDVAVDKAH